MQEPFCDTSQDSEGEVWCRAISKLARWGCLQWHDVEDFYYSFSTWLVPFALVCGFLGTFLILVSLSLARDSAATLEKAIIQLLFQFA